MKATRGGRGENTEWTTTLVEIVDNLEVTGDIITKPEELAETMMERRTRRRVTYRDDDGTVTYSDDDHQ